MIAGDVMASDAEHSVARGHGRWSLPSALCKWRAFALKFARDRVCVDIQLGRPWQLIVGLCAVLVASHPFEIDWEKRLLRVEILLATS